MNRPTLLALAVALAVALPEAGAIPIEDFLNPQQIESSPGASSIAQGLEALKQNDLAAAEKAFRAAIATDPKAGAAYLGLAEVAGRRGNDAAVVEWLRKGQAAAPSEAGLRLSAGRWHWEHGQYAEAEKALMDAARVAPNSASVLSTLAEFYLARKKTLPQAEATFRRAVAADGNYVPAKVGLARALAGNGKLKEAQSTLEAATRAAPDNPMPVHAMARLAAGQGKMDEAIAYHERAIAIDANFVPAYMDQGDLHLARGDTDAAIAAYKAGAHVARDPVPLLFRVGVAYEAAQRWDDAEQAYLDVLARDAKVYGAYNNLAAMAAARRVKLDQALEWARKANELAPKDAAVRDTLGWVYRARGQLDQAATTLEQASRLNPKDPAIQYRLGIVYGESGRRKESVAALKRALSIDPRFRSASDARKRLEELGER